MDHEDPTSARPGKLTQPFYSLHDSAATRPLFGTVENEKRDSLTFAQRMYNTPPLELRYMVYEHLIPTNGSQFHVK
jgi:hypothetical protein